MTYAKVIENLNVLDYEYYFKLTDLFYNGKVAETFLLFDEIMTKGFDAGNLIAGLGKHFRDLLVAKDEVTLSLLEVSASIRERYLRQAKEVDVDFIFNALKVIEQCEMQYKVRVEKRLCVEITLIKLCQINALKKKSLSIEEFAGLLKIDGFVGKFKQETDSTVSASTNSRPEVKSGKTPAIHSFKLKQAMAESKDYVEIRSIPEVQKIEKKVKAQDPFDEKSVSSVLSTFIDSSVGEAVKVASYITSSQGQRICRYHRG